MKLLQDSEEAEASTERKLMKSQVEKRRRERMNRSLERLRSMLLQEPEQGKSRQRVEKAEILEHTVLFLQNAVRAKKKAAGGSAGGGGKGGGGGGEGGGGGAGGGEKATFQDGFSSCLQRAAQFLAPEGKGLFLRAALRASFAPRPDRAPADAKSVLRTLRQKSNNKLGRRAALDPRGAAPHPHPHPRRLGAPHRFAGLPPGAQGQNRPQQQIRTERPDAKRSPSPSSPNGQSLWRPWS